MLAEELAERRRSCLEEAREARREAVEVWLKRALGSSQPGPDKGTPTGAHLQPVSPKGGCLSPRRTPGPLAPRARRHAEHGDELQLGGLTGLGTPQRNTPQSRSKGQISATSPLTQASSQGGGASFGALSQPESPLGGGSSVSSPQRTPMAPRGKRPVECDEVQLGMMRQSSSQSRSKDLSKGQGPGQVRAAPTPARSIGRNPDTPSSGTDGSNSAARLKQGVCSAASPGKPTKAPSLAPRPGAMACNRPGRRSLDSIHHGAEKAKPTSHRLQVMRQNGPDRFSSPTTLSTVDDDGSPFRPTPRTRQQASPAKKERKDKVDTHRAPPAQDVESSCSVQ